MANVNPPQAVPQLGPQPNFGLLTQGLQQATTELGNLANLPPFAQGNALLQQMQQMQQQMQQMQQQMQQNFTNVRTDIRAIRTDIRAIRTDVRTLRRDTNINHRATEYNSIARLQNAAARRPDHPLTALIDYTTNTDIPAFPATPAQLANMTGVGLDPILTSLGLPVNGTVGTKRQRLKFYIGLTEMP